MPEPSAAAPSTPGALIAELRRRQPLLTAFGLALALLMLPAALAMALDPRTVGDSRAWVKPLKFLAALSLFALTSAWAFGHLSAAARRSATARTAVLLIVTMSSFEIAYIAWQAGHGRASHFNTGDAFHALMYSLMGLGAVLLTASSGLLAALLARHAVGGLPAAFRLSLVLGFALTAVLGIVTGGLMSAQPGHFTGVLPQGRTLPVFGWSLTGGDHRVAHFFGMHAQQALPLAGVLLQRQAPAIAVPAVWLAAAAWCALVALTLWQAWAGLPFHAVS